MRLSTHQIRPEAVVVESIAEGEAIEVTIDRWLEVVAALSRIAEGERSALKDELSAHLHDRVRDLELSGHQEHEALRRAIAELGDAAQLARSISEAHRYPRRRIIMNCTIIGLGLAAVGVGLVSFNGAAAGGPGRAFEVTQDARIAEALPQKTNIQFDDVTLVEAIEYMDGVTDRSIYVYWEDLSDLGISRDDPEMTLRLSLENIPLGRAMELMLQELAYTDELAWRAGDELIELGSAERFDRRETTLVSYDISSTLQSLWEHYDVEFDEGRQNIASLIMDMVEPNHWEDMGGAVARYNVVGGKLFIQAPPRMHERVQWLLNELDADAGVAVGDREGAAETGESIQAALLREMREEVQFLRTELAVIVAENRALRDEFASKRFEVDSVPGDATGPNGVDPLSAAPQSVPGDQ